MLYLSKIKTAAVLKGPVFVFVYLKLRGGEDLAENMFRDIQIKIHGRKIYFVLDQRSPTGGSGPPKEVIGYRIYLS